MTETERKALALVNEVAAKRGTSWLCIDRENDSRWEALCRFIEQHEAYKQEVSDAVEADIKNYEGLTFPRLRRFIIAKPVDPLVEIAREMTLLDGVVRTDSQKAAIRDGRAGRTASDDLHARLRAALAGRGGKIVWGRDDEQFW